MALSKMMQHYLETKKQHEDCVIFYRLGDFYEMFFEDAELCSKELDLTLTGKDCGLESRAPMCGIPYHAANGYIQKLIENGHKVAICEQLTEPTKSSKLVERGVVKIITPGTVFDSEMLDDEKNNYIASIHFENGDFAVAWVDISTGEFNVSSYTGENAMRDVNQALIRISPAEIISTKETVFLNENLEVIKQKLLPKINFVQFEGDISEAKKLILDQFKNQSLNSLGLEGKMLEIKAISTVLFYLNETQKQFLCHINSINFLNDKKFMVLDSKVRKNLEIFENASTGKKQGSLLGVLNKTETSMGARLLRSFISEPLIDKSLIESRLDGVDELVRSPIALGEIKNVLKGVRDVERLTGRVASGSLLPRQAKAILESLKVLPEISKLLEPFGANIISGCKNSLLGLDDVTELLSASISNDPPQTFKEGGYIKKGFSSELDEFRSAKEDGTKWIAKLEATEKELTGIKNLRIGFNNNFGFYIEVLNSQKDLVPYRYVRKQTTTNAERYITEELKEIEEKVLNADENAAKLEFKIFCEIRNRLLDYVHKFQQLARSLALIDVLCSFASLAISNNYVRPQINENGNYEITDGRHPVVEKFTKDGVFNPNDTSLNNENNIMLITGPNMAGKSTYMRQVAIITLMAHIGCFVPAKSANISITDRIFTRIGASDDLAFGQSTFMVEMTESATILKEATERSLIVLDEVGRGTSTFDGLSIAYAIIDFLSKNVKAKTLFATHYHELTALEGTHKGVVNYHVCVKEFAGEVIFLHKILKGGTDKSFGIEVASLAGLPKQVISSAKNYLSEMEKKEFVSTSVSNSNTQDDALISLNEKAVLNALERVDINMLSPMKALELITSLQEKLKGGPNEN